ncbi:Death effector domain-containing protein like [Argiope bruennichi]|uniref:Death effector domain-containing protein like n=1 Tax=Argiope bruennichi TaxID=94029 RepID=A0A8T0FM31_ARGBR|nr:Death effector domain-containing protein like [Argiope bruennichi]
MCDRVGSHLTYRDVSLLTILSGTVIDASLKRRIKNGKDLLLALSKSGYCDESNLSSIIELLKTIKRHDLLHMIHMRQKTKVTLDPVEEYLKNISQVPQNVEPVAGCAESDHELRITGGDKAPESGPSSSSNDRISFPENGPPPSKRLRRSQRLSKRSLLKNESDEGSSALVGLRKKYTCDVRLRVRAEYCNYQSVLQGNVSSVKPDPVERRLECFSQASAILRARDLGYIVCDIKFSEITYLDAFWRDYLNGSLLEALKGVFITESLKQAVGNEAIKLLVNVEESDYEKGRALLMKNLRDIESNLSMSLCCKASVYWLYNVLDFTY